MNSNKLTLSSKQYPNELRHISSPPKNLYYSDDKLFDLLSRPRVAIVGSRRLSTYGRQVTTQLASKLAEQGIVIVSGLAFGVDSLAHQATLDVGGLTLAVLPGPIETIYPRRHEQLAGQIVASGGALVSEYAAGMPGLKQNFIARNRIVAGLSQAVMITEAAEKSGSLHTARFALEQGKDVLAVPGNISSPLSVGTNNLIKAGAVPVTNIEDVLATLGLTAHQTKVQKVKGRNRHEQAVIDLLIRGVNDGEQLLRGSQLNVTEFNQVLTMLEISGKVRSLGANQWTLR